ncbi:MAG: phosphodiesterase [Actinobacteria bacterium]|nr:phosphodiesterase [Actinomycetota bacterium]
MDRPFLLAQISDLHLGERARDGVKPKRCLRTVVAALGRLPDPPDAVLVSGDVAEHGAPKEYRLAAKTIGRLGVPIYVLPGNHDDRATMRASFGIPGEGDAPIDYAVDLGPLRLVVVDSTIPGEDRGGFEAGQLERLEAELGASPKPAIVAMHQPPLTTTMADWDGVNLPAADRGALARVIARHPQVKAIVGGHLHRVASAALAGCPVLAAPSTYLQARPNFAAETVELYGGAPGFAVHVLRGEELSTQVEIVTPSGD